LPNSEFQLLTSSLGKLTVIISLGICDNRIRCKYIFYTKTKVETNADRKNVIHYYHPTFDHTFIITN